MTLNADKTGRLIQLDSLRAFAVFAVFVTHSELRSLQVLPWGVLGVDLFFVLSGFVITRLLLNARFDSMAIGTVPAVFQFYARRLLRILAPYYVAILIFALLGNPHIRTGLLWHLTYTSNFFFAIRSQLDLLGAHFWTLAVEEQFYIFWPWVVLALPLRWMKFVFAACVAAALGYRLWVAGHDGGLAAVVMLFANIDKFAIGGFIALDWFARSSTLDRLFRDRRWIVPIGLIAAGAAGFLPQVWQPIAPLVRATGFGCLIHAAGRGLKGGIGRILESKALRYLGTTSYGLYVYHPFCAWLVAGAFRRLASSSEAHPYAHFTLFSILSILIASVSWFMMERPLNRLKDRFDFRAAPSPLPVILAESASIGGGRQTS
ncbi:MAG: acyltransferase [Bryobacteraceae bacterium]